jgi:RNA-binding protein
LERCLRAGLFFAPIELGRKDEMAELMLSRDERLRLKSESHHLEAVVLVGANGLSEAVMNEIDRALAAHELIKVRTPVSAREERERMFAHVANQLGAARVQLIGRLMVLFRPAPEEPSEPSAGRPHPRASRAASPASGRGDKKTHSMPSRKEHSSPASGRGDKKTRSMPSRKEHTVPQAAEAKARRGRHAPSGRSEARAWSLRSPARRQRGRG